MIYVYAHWTLFPASAKDPRKCVYVSPRRSAPLFGTLNKHGIVTSNKTNLTHALIAARFSCIFVLASPLTRAAAGSPAIEDGSLVYLDGWMNMLTRLGSVAEYNRYSGAFSFQHNNQTALALNRLQLLTLEPMRSRNVHCSSLGTDKTGTSTTPAPRRMRMCCLRDHGRLLAECSFLLSRTHCDEMLSCGRCRFYKQGKSSARCIWEDRIPSLPPSRPARSYTRARRRFRPSSTRFHLVRQFASPPDTVIGGHQVCRMWVDSSQRRLLISAAATIPPAASFIRKKGPGHSSRLHSVARSVG
ncbi:hypothetical protein EVG20_g2960 [Dentipellis fragilis]|uniref:Uncharacterized protein n=1 Tax=Dentipellis fragilis TaxID=205917 RepID=A0A4Y9Z5T7_9AGAM|nr:hypothetical protein EVG20_g2960 [Dentipellis fragilis]